MPRTQVRGTEIATIDSVLITVSTGTEEDGKEIMLNTASKIEVAPQVETTDAIKLIVKRRLIAQKGATSVLTGNTITLTDNVFTPELVQILQGGTIKMDSTGKKIESYTPPVIGSNEAGEYFILNAYSAQYDSAGKIVQYEKISYPNCQGIPINISSEDDVFRVGEYTINSYPADGEAPYVITYVAQLPQFPVAPANFAMRSAEPVAETSNYQDLYERANENPVTAGNMMAPLETQLEAQNTRTESTMEERSGESIQGSTNDQPALTGDVSGMLATNKEK